MTNQEFSNEFDTLLNSYAGSNYFGKTNGPLELDEYEKSIFLTQAQEKVVLDYYSGNNQKGLSYEKTEEVRKSLDSLNKTALGIKCGETGKFPIGTTSELYTIPNDVWFITYENADGKMVVPVTQDEYHKVSRNPFRQANDNKVLRLDYNSSVVELITTKSISKYLIKYLSKPSPIILVDLPDGLTINGLSTATECTLHSSLHRIILEQAVILAFNSRVGQRKENN